MMEKGNQGYKKGLWTAEEDKILVDYVKLHGKGHWNSICKRTVLKRCGKSCRLRWMNYLNPAIKRGHFCEEEEDLIIRLHKLLGNRWSLIAGRIPGRTDNQVKNYWNTYLSKKLGINNEPRNNPVGCNSAAADSEANNNTCSGEFDQASFHSDSHPQSLSCAVTIFPSTESAPFMEIDQASKDLSSQGYVTTSSLWASEFDGLTGDSETNPGCFMDLISRNSFNLDWNHL